MTPKWALCLAVLLASTRASAAQVVLKGCLQGGSDQLYLTTLSDSQSYKLTGNTSPLIKYAWREVSIEGAIEESRSPFPLFHITRLKQVLDIPQPRLTPSLQDSSLWQRETNAKYGIEFLHPRAWGRIPDPDWSMVRPNFAADNGAVIVGRFSMPRDLYPDSNFVGGTFGIFVNPQITNAQSCAQFGDADPRLLSSSTAGNIEYSVYAITGGAGGTSYGHRDFHTFQNGLCYQISFEFAEWNTANSDTGCTVPVLKEADEIKIVDPLLAAVAFSKPTASVLPNQNAAPAAPRVIDFNATPTTADTAANHGRITLSWQTENADYVQLSYRCFPAPNGPGVTILEENVQRACANNAMKLGDSIRPNRSPNASLTVLLGNFLQPEPISIAVTLTPLSRATAYPSASKSLTVQVNPFPRGPRRPGTPH